MIEQATIENLRDAGCNDTFIAQFVKLTESNQTEDRLKLLSQHRDSLLDRIHKDQKRIDCLDYLVYQIRKTL